MDLGVGEDGFMISIEITFLSITIFAAQNLFLLVFGLYLVCHPNIHSTKSLYM